MQYTSVPAQFIEAGVSVVTGDAHSITYRLGGRAVTADLLRISRISSAAAVLRRANRQPGHRVLVACDFISNSARSALLTHTDVDLSVGSTGELVLSGKTLKPPATPPPAAAHRSRRRRAAERVCLLTREHLRQVDVAAAVAVTQQAVSKMTEKEPLPKTPMTEAARRELLTKLSLVLADDGLVETYWYGIDPVVEQVRSSIRLGAELSVQILAGGEVAADVLQPWRVPTRGLVYAEELVDLSVLNLVEATAEEATLTLRVPADPTVWTTATWWRRVNEVQQQSDIATVDPVIALQDLNASADLGDAAPQRLSDWIVRR